MGCGTSKEAVISSDGSGRCSRKLFRRKSSVVATGAHQPLAAKDNGDVVKHHKAASAPEKAVEKRSGKAGKAAPVVEGSDEVVSTVIGAKVIGEKKEGEEIKKDGKEVAIGATDAKGEKETASEKFTGEKKDEGVSDKEVVADLIKDDVASATGSVVIVQEEEEGTENGEPVEVSIVADEREDEDQGVSSAGANDEEGWSTEKDIEEIAVDEDDSTVTFADGPVGVATVADDGALISADAPDTEEDEITDFPSATVAGDDGVAAPVAKEDELVSFASAPLAEEVDGVILPAAPVGEEVDVAAFTVTPVAKPNGSVVSIDTPVAKKDESVTIAATPEVPEDDVAATVDAAASTTANEDEGVMSTAAPASTEDERAPTVDVAAPTTTNYDEIVASAAAPVANEDESLTSPAASEVEVAEQPTPSLNDDELRNEQELPEPTAVEEPTSEADHETEQAKEPEELVNVEQEEDESVVPQEPEEEATSAAASRNDDGESDGKQAVALNDAANTDQLPEGEEPSVEEKRDDEEPAAAPNEPSLS